MEPPKSTSYTGGIRERMIRSVRKHLHALVGNSLVDGETLLNVSSKTEKVVNDCPLTSRSFSSNAQHFTSMLQEPMQPCRRSTSGA